ncbi:MAG: oligosaccharide repeat unit polymerase [Ignavibacteriales bacterium]|jgi:oligosaccharide repeat unit polymerase|nr:oligosaccharide repeat unit polymerase [Melioribacteraceae bacterium]RJP57679.1 MAG: oligosaccharide repeat unit polymerase [Ignavibacteriales bacterium]
MTLVSFIAFIVFVIVLFTFSNKEKDVFSPSKIFVAIWALVIGLADLKFSRLQTDFSGFSWLMIGISIFSFLLGLYIAFVLFIDKNLFPKNTVRDKIREFRYDEVLFFRLILIVFSIYFVAYWGNVFFEGFIPIFHARPSESRVYFGVFGLGMLIHLAPVVLFLIVEFFVLVKENTGKKILLVFLGLITFILYFFLLQRFNLILFVTMSMVFVYFSSYILTFRKFIIFSGTLAAFVFAVNLIRWSKFAANFLYYYSQMKFDIKYAILTEPYMYLVMNVENFARAVARLEEHSFGYYTFNYLFSLTGTKRVLSEYLHLNDYPFLISGYNTYTMFWDFYRDFGVFGLSIIPLFLGLVCAISYYRMKQNPNITTVTLYSVAVFVMMFSFFNNFLGLLHFVFSVAIILLMQQIIRNNPKKPTLAENTV